MEAFDIVPVVILLGAAVVAVPLFKRIGLGSVLGYLAAGLAIGPFGANFFDDPMAILHVAELGVVMFLFLIGLEMEPSRLWAMRRDIFGLGLTQLLAGIAALSWVGWALGYPFAQSVIAGAGFVLTSTAIVMQTLEERGDLARPKGQRIVSILLLEDLAIVPLLALAAFLAPGGEGTTWADRGLQVATGLAAIAGLVLAGRYLLDPLFAVLARARAREVMTAAALLVVLGAALAMQLGGLSAAMGAFLAGVLLSGSSFRHQLEADVQPFRGILLGLFFLAVGMSLDLAVIARNWPVVLLSLAGLTALKALVVYAVARAFRAGHAEAMERTALMTQGGEFAFVLYATAMTVGLISAEGNAILTAVVILSMALTPLYVAGLNRLGRPAADDGADLDGPDGAPHGILLVGFGRFGQIVAQPLLARGYDIAIIDTDPEMIRAAATFGFKVQFGDGGRLDILRAAGAEGARAILVCIDVPDTATRIVRMARDAFPQAAVMVRAFDRVHAMDLIRAGATAQVRETFHSALDLSARTLAALDEDAETVAELIEDARRRDAERLALQLVEGDRAGSDLLRGNHLIVSPDSG